MQAIPKKIAGISTKLVILAIAGVLFFFGFYSYINGLQQGGVQRETRISRSYETMKTGLDSFLSSAREAAGVTKASSAAFDKIMLDAVQGRYQGKEGAPTTAQPGSGTLFSAIQEQYPNLDKVTENYSRIIDIITSGRTAFANNQAKFQDQLREYDQWRKSGIIRSKVVGGLVGLPSDNLIVRNGDQVLRGQAAYDKMSQAIVSNTTGNAFKSGDLEPQDFFGQ